MSLPAGKEWKEQEGTEVAIKLLPLSSVVFTYCAHRIIGSLKLYNHAAFYSALGYVMYHLSEWNELV